MPAKPRTHRLTARELVEKLATCSDPLIRAWARRLLTGDQAPRPARRKGVKG